MYAMLNLAHRSGNKFMDMLNSEYRIAERGVGT